jgi:hypothetical protein
MHYKIATNVVIKTENAAKPESQRSSYLTSLLSDLPQVSASFDYGCGKLRYCDVILDTTDCLAIVDSEIQLSRVQVLKGIESSIRDAVRRSNRIAVYNDAEFQQIDRRFDRGFCINVLSVVPILARRRQIIDLIWSRLQPNGTCLFVVQYRNSDFNRMRLMANARPWRDGFLIDSLRGFSFYGLISPDHLASMVKKAGFAVRGVDLNEGSVYLWGSKRSPG